jgi:hypothetical protein
MFRLILHKFNRALDEDIREMFDRLPIDGFTGTVTGHDSRETDSGRQWYLVVYATTADTILAEIPDGISPDFPGYYYIHLFQNDEFNGDLGFLIGHKIVFKDFALTTGTGIVSVRAAKIAARKGAQSTGITVERFPETLGRGFFEWAIVGAPISRLQTRDNHQISAIRFMGIFMNSEIPWSKLGTNRKHFRRLIAYKRGLIPIDGDVDAITKSNKPLLISGHAERFLMASELMPCDVDAALAIIEGNILLSMRDRDFSMWAARATVNPFNERLAQYELWHNYLELDLAALTAEYQLRLVGIRATSVQRFRLGIHRFAQLYPSFRNVTPLALRLYPGGAKGRV